MLAVTRHTVPEGGADAFRAQVAEVLALLAGRAGHRGGRAARAVDDPAEWVIVTEWEDVGSYRRALSAYDVRVAALPLLSGAHDEPSAFEVLLDGETGERASDRAG